MPTRPERPRDIPTRFDGPRGAVLLKWHRLKAAADDPEFTLDRLKSGLAAGAAMEVDLRALSDGGWAVLHDATLDRETTGRGPVDGVDRAGLKRLRLRGPDGAPTETAPLILEDLAAAVAAAAATDAIAPGAIAPGAWLQFDLKAGVETVTSAHADAFAAAVAPVARFCHLSGTDFVAVSRLARDLPALELGYDPSLTVSLEDLETAAAAHAWLEAALGRAPAARWIYLHYAIVLALGDRGLDPGSLLAAAGKRLDVFTLDPGRPDESIAFDRCCGLGVAQITTNDALGWRAARSASIEEG